MIIFLQQRGDSPHNGQKHQRETERWQASEIVRSSTTEGEAHHQPLQLEPFLRCIHVLLSLPLLFVVKF